MWGAAERLVGAAFVVDDLRRGRQLVMRYPGIAAVAAGGPASPTAQRARQAVADRVLLGKPDFRPLLERFLGMDAHAFANFFRPKAAVLCDKLLDIGIDELRFLSYPVLLQDPEDSDRELVFFSLVFAFADDVGSAPFPDRPACADIAQEVLAKLSRAWRGREAEDRYLSREVSKLLAIREKFSRGGFNHVVHNPDALVLERPDRAPSPLPPLMPHASHVSSSLSPEPSEGPPTLGSHRWSLASASEGPPALVNRWSIISASSAASFGTMIDSGPASDAGALTASPSARSMGASTSRDAGGSEAESRPSARESARNGDSAHSRRPSGGNAASKADPDAGAAATPGALPDMMPDNSAQDLIDLMMERSALANEIRIAFHGIADAQEPFAIYVDEIHKVQISDAFLSVGDVDPASPLPKAPNAAHPWLSDDEGDDEADSIALNGSTAQGEAGAAGYRPYQTILLLQDMDQILNDIPRDAPELIRDVIKIAQPTESFQQLAEELMVPLRSIYSLADHLVAWKKARVVDTITMQSCFAVAPDAAVDRGTLGPTGALGCRFAATFPDTSLISALSLFEPGKPLMDVVLRIQALAKEARELDKDKVGDDGDLDNDAAAFNSEIAADAVTYAIWGLRHGLLVQLRQYITLSVGFRERLWAVDTDMVEEPQSLRLSGVSPAASVDGDGTFFIGSVASEASFSASVANEGVLAISNAEMVRERFTEAQVAAAMKEVEAATQTSSNDTWFADVIPGAAKLCVSRLLEVCAEMAAPALSVDELVVQNRGWDKGTLLEACRHMDHLLVVFAAYPA
mmetsp:Transcript_9873/g.29015  ORF Transcript_9873/g.29015 Transcript_9873/m.29015 type:complete len:803 (-) Transcript_9873:105-2513(-)